MPKCVLLERCLLVLVTLMLAFGSGPSLHADAADDLTDSLTPAEGGLIDLSMYRDPLIESPEQEQSFHPRLKPLWLEALARDEASTRLEAARAFAEAARKGMTDLGGVAARLIEVVREDANAHVALAAAQALIAMQHVEAAPAFLERAQVSGDDFVLTADDALAVWEHEPARQWWLTRLEDETASRRARVSAIRALGRTRTAAVEAALRELALAPAAAIDVRFAAGEALGRIASAGLADDARAVAADGDATVADRLVAARMLAGHDGEAALALAEQWAQDDDPTVARRAMANLNAHAPDRAAVVARPLLSHRDANVRLEALRAVAAQQTPEAVQTVAEYLDDVAPELRIFARRTLAEYDEQASLRPLVREQIERILASASSWRALEQVALLAAVLDHKPAAMQLAALLPHDRPEVRLAAANAMRVLEVPETLQAIQARAEQLTELETPEAGRQASEEATQLFHAIGQMRYTPADALLRRYVPKESGFSAVSRSAAIWALGRLHEGEAQPDLARALIGRVTDQAPMPPESESVQRFAAITLGRLDAQEQVAALRGVYESTMHSDTLRAACRWAVEQLTGEQLPPLEARSSYITDWFLEPID